MDGKKENVIKKIHEQSQMGSQLLDELDLESPDGKAFLDSLPEDSRSILVELSAKYVLALLTDGFLPAQRLKVQALGIEDYFDSIVYTEELGREFWKPSPAGFEKIMRDLNAKPENVVYIADNEKKDFIAPNRLGLSSVQLIRPARIHASSSQESDSAAQHVTHHIRQLPAIIGQL